MTEVVRMQIAYTLGLEDWQAYYLHSSARDWPQIRCSWDYRLRVARALLRPWAVTVPVAFVAGAALAWRMFHAEPWAQAHPWHLPLWGGLIPAGALAYILGCHYVFTSFPARLRPDQKRAIRRSVVQCCRNGSIHTDWRYSLTMSAEGLTEVAEREDTAPGFRLDDRMEVRAEWSAVEGIDAAADHVFIRLRMRGGTGWVMVPRGVFASDQEFRAFAEAARKYLASRPAEGGFTATPPEPRPGPSALRAGPPVRWWL
jgi:hypothetical protein